VRVLGSDPATSGPGAGWAFVLETDGLYDNLSARDNLAYYGRLYGVGDLAGRIEAVLDTRRALRPGSRQGEHVLEGYAAETGARPLDPSRT